jgi:hypothetical protein
MVFQVLSQHNRGYERQLAVPDIFLITFLMSGGDKYSGSDRTETGMGFSVDPVSCESVEYRR